MSRIITDFKINTFIGYKLISRKSDTDDVLVRTISGSLKKAIDFFEYKDDMKFEIELVYSRSEMNEIIGFESEDWLSAYSFGDRFVIFHPDYLEKCSSHKRAEFGPIITHEACHALTRRMNADFSTWLNEGVALYVAGQNQDREIMVKSKKYFIENCLFINSDYNRFAELQGYEISRKVVDYLFQKYSKDKMLELLGVKFGYNRSAEESICKVLGLRMGDFAKMISSSFD